MSSKRKSPPSKLSADGLNSDQTSSVDPFRSDHSEIDEVLRSELADKILADRISQGERENNHLLDQNDNKINYHSSPESEDLISKLSSDEFHVAVQGFNNTRLEFDSIDVPLVPKTPTERPVTSLDQEQDSCDSLTSDGVLAAEHSQKDNVAPSSRKHRLLLSVSSTRSETTSDSEYDSETCLNGVDPGTFPCDFLQASLKPANSITEDENGPRESPDLSHNKNFHYPYSLQPEIPKALPGGQGKRTMDDVLRRLTSKISSSAPLKDRHAPGPESLIIANVEERNFYSRSPTPGR